MKERKKNITVDRETYKIMYDLHLLPLDVDVEITGKREVKKEDASKN